jgi:hypothetical protein
MFKRFVSRSSVISGLICLAWYVAASGCWDITSWPELPHNSRASRQAQVYADAGWFRSKLEDQQRQDREMVEKADAEAEKRARWRQDPANIKARDDATMAFKKALEDAAKTNGGTTPAETYPPEHDAAFESAKAWEEDDRKKLEEARARIGTYESRLNEGLAKIYDSAELKQLNDLDDRERSRIVALHAGLVLFKAISSFSVGAAIVYSVLNVFYFVIVVVFGRIVAFPIFRDRQMNTPRKVVVALILPAIIISGVFTLRLEDHLYYGKDFVGRDHWWVWITALSCIAIFEWHLWASAPDSRITGSDSPSSEVGK